MASAVSSALPSRRRLIRNIRRFLAAPEMNMRRICLLLISGLIAGCAAPDPLPSVWPRTDNDRTAFRLLYSIAPELRQECLELVNEYGGSALGDFQANFRYLDAPEPHSRLLVLRRTVPADGSTPSVSLEFCHARKYFRPFKNGGGQERWAILDRKPHAK